MRFIKTLLFGGAGAATVTGDVGLLILRAGMGFLMAAGHGFGKVWGEHGFGPPEQLVGGVTGMGFPSPVFFAWMAALTEFFAAILLGLGLLTRPAALLLSINMFVAAFVAHGSDPLFMKGPGPAKEFALLYLLPFAMFMFVGGGRFAVDRLLAPGRAKPAPSPA